MEYKGPRDVLVPVTTKGKVIIKISLRTSRAGIGAREQGVLISTARP